MEIQFDDPSINGSFLHHRAYPKAKTELEEQTLKEADTAIESASFATSDSRKASATLINEVIKANALDHPEYELIEVGKLVNGLAVLTYKKRLF